MYLEIIVAADLARFEGTMAEQDPEGWAHWGEVYEGNERIAYGCCDQRDRRNIKDNQNGNMEVSVAVVQE